MRLRQLVTAIAQRMGIEASEDPELAELARDIAPEKVLDTMEAHQQRFNDDENYADDPERSRHTQTPEGEGE